MLATLVMAGATAVLAVTRKDVKYSPFLTTHDSVALASETIGPIDSTGIAFITNLGSNLTHISGGSEKTATCFNPISKNSLL